MQGCESASEGGGSSDALVVPSWAVADAVQADPVARKLPLSTNHRRWNDWLWQMKNRIRTMAQLTEWFPVLRERLDLELVAGKYPMAITPYYASLIKTPDPSDPIFRMCVPDLAELNNPPFLRDDPLEEEQDMPVWGLVHRYPDRALLLVTTGCSLYCRHCTRKRVAGTREVSISPSRLAKAAAYLAAHPEITDVIVSGGDPFTLPTGTIENVLATIRAVPSVQIIRIGTRTPVVLPMRITDELTEMLRKYHPLWVNTHFNHPDELTTEAAEACARLADAGIPLGNQSVLLRGINDTPRTIEDLCRGLIRMRVRPYYLFQCDLVRGIEHFRTPISRGLEIMEYLRGRVSGLAIPTFVVDAPHGGGKIPVLPNYVVSMSPTATVLRNFEGMLVSYPEPCRGSQEDRSELREDETPGVWELVSGRASAIHPARARRYQRRFRQECSTLVEIGEPL